MKPINKKHMTSLRMNDFLATQVDHYADATEKTSSAFIRDAILNEVKRLKNLELKHQDLRFS